ncbi:MAG: PAS domain S-box protein [Desulfomonile tiedjei]|nr:PAS domain S-box protein [Desulfomonile tiedjei]
MKTRTVISLAQYAVMGALAVDLIVILQRMALGADLFEIPGLIVSTVLGGAAGALVKHYFLKTDGGANRLAISSDAPEPELAASEIPADRFLSVVDEAKIPIEEAASGLTEQGTGPEESAGAQTEGGEGGSARSVEEPELLPPVRDIAEEEPLSEPGIPGELPTQAELDEGEQPLQEQERLSQIVTAALEDRVDEQKSTELLPQTETDFPARFMEHAAIFFAVLDPHGKIVIMNPAILECLGYSSAEVIGVDFVTNFVPERSRTEGWDDLLNSAAKPAPMTREGFVLSRDGREVPVEWHGTPVFDSTDKLSHYVLVGIDVSVRRRAEQAWREAELQARALCEEAQTGLECYRSALDSFPDALVIYDTEGKATYTNPAFSEEFGWSVDELREEESPFIPASQRELEGSMIEGLIRNGIPCKDFDAKRSCKDGGQVSAKLTAWPFHGGQGEVAGVLVFLREIAPDKAVEKEREHPKPEPGKRQIRAKDVVQDIRAGLTDPELMEKHKLTAKGLQSVFQKLLQANIAKPSEIYGRLSSYDETVAIEVSRIPVTEPPEPQKKTIKSSKITADIRAGIADSQMMDKYGLTATGLDNVFKQLVAAGVVSEDEIERKAQPDTREQEQDQQQEDETVNRALPRNYMVVSVPIYEANNLLSEGTIIDISEKGLKIQGIKTMEGEKKGLLVQGTEFHDVFPFVFDAVCRWTQTDESTGETVAGYQITAITDAGLQELRKLMAALSIGA